MARGALPGWQSTAEGAAHSNSTPLYDQDAFLDAAEWDGMTVTAVVLFTSILHPTSPNGNLTAQSAPQPP